MIFLHYMIFVLSCVFSTVLAEEHHAEKYQANSIKHPSMDSNDIYGQEEHHGETYQPNAEIYQPNAEINQPNAEINQPNAEIYQPTAEMYQHSADIDQPNAEINQPNAEIYQPIAEMYQPNSEIYQPNVEIYQPNLINHHNMDSNYIYGQGGNLEGNYHPNVINQHNKDPKYISGQVYKAHQAGKFWPSDICPRVNSIGGRMSYSASLETCKTDCTSNNKCTAFHYNHGSSLCEMKNCPILAPEPTGTTSSSWIGYSIDSGRTITTDSRHYIHIGRDSLKENIPEFELGLSSKDFIHKQVDTILNVINGKDNKTLQIATKEYTNNNNITKDNDNILDVLFGKDNKTLQNATKGTNNKKITIVKDNIFNFINVKDKQILQSGRKVTTNNNLIKAKDCDQLYNQGNTSSQNAQIFPYSCCPDKQVSVRCDQDHDGGRWTIIQSRGACLKKASQANFERNWNDYVNGFGKLEIDQDGEYWIGLEALHDLTSGARQELFISLEDHAGNTRWAKYKNVFVGGPKTNYKLTIGGYSGDAGNSLKYHNNQPFSTADKDNDQLKINCAEKYSGGWWFRGCQRSNLNGVHADAPGRPTENGITWVTFKGYDISLHSVTMKIRPVSPKKD